MGKVIWTDGYIKQELTEILSLEMSRTEMRNKYPALFAAIDRRFGSLDDCGEYYGLKIPRKSKNNKYTKDEVDEFILTSYREGKTGSYLRKNTFSRRLYDATVRIYGGWNNALKAHNIKPVNAMRRFNSKEDVASTYMQDLADGMGRGDRTYRKSIEKYFGSIENLEKYLGIHTEAEIEVLELYGEELLDKKVYEILRKESEKISAKILDTYDKNVVYSIRHYYSSITEYFSRLDIDFYAKPYVPFMWNAENTKRQLLRWIREGKPVNYSSVSYKHNGIIEASRKIYGSYEGLFTACGLNYKDYRTDTTLSSFYGRELEDVFEDILKDLKISYERQPEINGCHPDFVSGDTWYDAKLSEWTISHADCGTVKKYEPHCDKLIIVFLRGNEHTDRMISDKTRLVNIYKFVEMLPNEKQEKYKVRLSEIQDSVASNEIGNYSSDNKTA